MVYVFHTHRPHTTLEIDPVAEIVRTPSPEFDATMEKLKAAKRTAPSGAGYWMARDILPILGYRAWAKFEPVLKRAMDACRNAGSDPSNHFAQTSNMVELGSGAERRVGDYFLSRLGCYLIAMNGDPAKAEIAAAQAYFVVQTRRMEVRDEMSPDHERLVLRQDVTEATKALIHAAKAAGVERFGLFHNAGYEGLYGMGLRALKVRKGIGDKENPMDRAGRAELAANAFRITQTELKITHNNVRGEENAITTHRAVGLHVRNTIKDIRGTMPEDLPTEPPIKDIKKKFDNPVRAKLPKKKT